VNNANTCRSAGLQHETKHNLVQLNRKAGQADPDGFAVDQQHTTHNTQHKPCPPPISLLRVAAGLSSF